METFWILKRRGSKRDIETARETERAQQHPTEKVCRTHSIDIIDHTQRLSTDSYITIPVDVHADTSRSDNKSVISDRSTPLNRTYKNNTILWYPLTLHTLFFSFHTILVWHMLCFSSPPIPSHPFSFYSLSLSLFFGRSSCSPSLRNFVVHSAQSSPSCVAGSVCVCMCLWVSVMGQQEGSWNVSSKWVNNTGNHCPLRGSLSSFSPFTSLFLQCLFPISTCVHCPTLSSCLLLFSSNTNVVRLGILLTHSVGSSFLSDCCVDAVYSSCCC